ncbi:hypothetical protein [Echinicola salinicaeni]|nr:hypothetical protein [Echinicola salinicaeni]
MKKKKSKKENPSPKEQEWDYSEGFGGIPEEVDLTKNIGCGTSKKLKKES